MYTTKVKIKLHKVLQVKSFTGKDIPDKNQTREILIFVQVK